MKKKLSIRFYCLVICLMYGRKVTGSELDLTYTTEVQTNFRKEGKWVNLLRLDYSCPLGRNFRFSFSSISIAETRQDALVDDMQGFSNIEEKNLPFAPAEEPAVCPGGTGTGIQDKPFIVVLGSKECE